MVGIKRGVDPSLDLVRYKEQVTLSWLTTVTCKVVPSEHGFCIEARNMLGFSVQNHEAARGFCAKGS